MGVYLFLHLFGAVLFLGNIIISAFWKVRADLSGDAAVIHQAARNVMLADFVFTLPGLILIIVTGAIMAGDGGYSLSGINWLTLSLLLLVLTGVLWAGALVPLQLRMMKYSAESVKTGAVSQAYRKISFYWAIFGTAATLLPVVILYLMINKNI